MTRKQKIWETYKEQNMNYPCVNCNKIADYVIELYDKENDEIIYKCKDCYLGDDND